MWCLGPATVHRNCGWRGHQGSSCCLADPADAATGHCGLGGNQLPPAVDLRFLPDNCVICSCKSWGVIALAGGDYDGDVIMICTSPDLLPFLAATRSRCCIRKLQSAAGFAKRQLVRKAPEPCSSLLDYINFCRKVPTPEVRGVTCAAADRVQMVTWKAKFPCKTRTT